MELFLDIAIALIALMVGYCAKLLLDIDQIKPGAPGEVRGQVLFKHFFLAPDFAVLAIVLLLASDAINSLLTSSGTTSTLGNLFDEWFTLLILFYVLALFVVILIWFLCGEEKYIPVRPIEKTYTGPGGTKRKKTTDSVMMAEGLRKKEGFRVLIVANTIGLLCVVTFGFFIAFAF